MEYLLDINSADENMLSKLKLHSPIPIQGGSYLAKLTLNDNPILFQMPKCSTKKGIVSSGKRFYCDLLFKYDDSSVIDFIENLETSVRDKVLEKNELWFQDPPSLEDIEYNWNESIKQTKQNFYLRTYIGNTKNIKSTISVYNSNQEQISMDGITSSSNIITIVEVTGLKFSSNSFHMNYCLRQVMVLEEKPIFNKCLINFTKKQKSLEKDNKNKQNKEIQDNFDTVDLEKTPLQEETDTNQLDKSQKNKEENIDLGEMSEVDKESKHSDDDLEILTVSTNNLIEEDLEKSEEQQDTENQDSTGLQSDFEDKNKEENIDLGEIPEVDKNNLENTSKNENESKDENNNEELQLTSNKDEQELENKKENSNDLEIREIELEMPVEDDLFQLKKPDTVYLDIYNKALQKAKDAKIKAIQAYLELKEIKNKYMIQEVDEDEENFGELDLEY